MQRDDGQVDDAQVGRTVDLECSSVTRGHAKHAPHGRRTFRFVSTTPPFSRGSIAQPPAVSVVTVMLERAVSWNNAVMLTHAR